LLKALGSRGKPELFQICCEIYDSGEWPADFLESIMIPIEKKQRAQEYVDFRTIPHASKIIVLKILTRRMEGKVQQVLGRNQYG